MDEPVIAGRKPAVVELEPGTHHWCSCGRSANQPLCDGSHEGTGFAPVEFVVTERRKIALCLCKRTKDPPRCDGSHADLE